MLAAPTLRFPGWGISGAPAGQAEGEEGGRGRGGGGSVGMSVAVLACWRPISQMIFATIKKCGGVKWQFHIQQGKGGSPGSWGGSSWKGGLFPSPLSSLC